MKAERSKLRKLQAWLDGQNGTYDLYLERPKRLISLELGMMENLIELVSDGARLLQEEPLVSSLPLTTAPEELALAVAEEIRRDAEASLSASKPELYERFRSLRFSSGPRTVELLEAQIFYDSPRLTGVSTR